MSDPDLTPQVPGEQNPDTQEPADGFSEDVRALTELNAPELIDGLAALDDDELTQLALMERDGKDRVTVLEAIESEQLHRIETGEAEQDPEPAPAPKTAHTADVPKGFNTPILTDEGWVCPEPHQRDGA